MIEPMTDRPDELDGRVAGLPRSIEPPEDLWGGIEARIHAQAVARRRRQRAVLGACSALAAAVVLAVLARPTPSDPSPDETRPGLERMAASPPVPRDPPIPEVRASPIADLEQAADELTRAFVQRRSLLGEELLAVYDENLGVIDDAIDSSRAALSSHPDDPHLREVLVQAYRHKLNVLRRATSEDEVLR